MKATDVTPTNMGTILSEIASGEVATNPWNLRLHVQAREGCVEQLMRCLGARYHDCSFENFEVYDAKNKQKEALAETKKFCEDMLNRVRHGGGLIFFGRPGTGKDHLMVAAMYFAILRYGFQVLWVDGMTLAQRIRDNIGAHSESISEKRLLDRYVDPQILAISDPLPPKGDTSQFITDVLQRIIDKRYRRGVSTWVTMNVHNSKEAEQRLASPIIDRLRHNSLTLSCNWESYRAR